jgi:hypothetical protein
MSNTCTKIHWGTKENEIGERRCANFIIGRVTRKATIKFEESIFTGALSLELQAFKRIMKQDGCLFNRQNVGAGISTIYANFGAQERPCTYNDRDIAFTGLRERSSSIRLGRNWKFTVTDSVCPIFHSELVVKRCPFDIQKRGNGFFSIQFGRPGNKRNP